MLNVKLGLEIFLSWSLGHWASALVGCYHPAYYTGLCILQIPKVAKFISKGVIQIGLDYVSEKMPLY